MPWFYLQAEDGAHQARRRDAGHSFLQSGVALTAWLLAMCRGGGCRRRRVAARGAQKNAGRMGERLGQGGEVGFVLSLLMTGGAFAFS